MSKRRARRRSRSAPPTRRVRDVERPRPSARKRGVFFVLYAIVGGVCGYGLVNAAPGADTSVFEPVAAAWIFGSALVCGTLAAIAPDTFPRWGRFRWRHDDD